MAALQQAPITFQSRLPTATRRNPVNVSFSGSLSSLRVPRQTVKLTGKSRSRGGSGGRALRVMASSTPAGSYATALADVAKATGTLETTSADIETVEKLFADPKTCEFFSSPIIGIEKKRQVIDEITSATKLLPHTVNFLNVLIDMNRIDLIKDIVKEFELVYNKLTDTELAIVTSVVKLDSQHLAQIAKGVQRLTGAKNVRIKTETDPSLVAGFTIRYGNSGSKMIDMSVKKQLEELAAELEIGDVQLAAV